ncbi:MAG TPA: FAD-dependent oxidoreductase, partial [Actinomycetota bacterium]|nr:FAD-dependent oxidoreductase [Actinomycetota bacterium]
AYAMETAQIASAVASEALARGADPDSLRAYPQLLRDEYEGYFVLGRGFVRLIGKAPVMSFLTKHGLKREWLMRFAFKILANLTEPRAGDASDRVINALVRAAPVLNKAVRV